MAMGVSACATSTEIYGQLEGNGFKKWFKTSLPLTLTYGVHNMLVGEVPDPYVETDLSDAIFDAANKCRDFDGGACGMKIYCGRGHSGKSVSAKLAIRRLRKDIGDAVHSYPAVYVNAKEDLVEEARSTFGVPRDMDDADWIEILFHHLPFRNQVNSLPSTSIFANCGCLGQVRDDAAYTNTPGNLPPMIVLDNVRTLLPDTIMLLAQIYQNVKVHRVLAVVLTDRVAVANYIVAMNDARVAPLENRFQLEEGFENYTRVPSPEYPLPGTIGGQTARGIVWQDEEWPRSKQHEYLVKFTEYANMATDGKHLNNFDNFFSFLVRGENPEQARLQARQYQLKRLQSAPECFLPLRAGWGEAFCMH